MKTIIIASALAAVVCIGTQSIAQEEPLRFFGEMMIDNRFRLDKEHERYWNENRLELTVGRQRIAWRTADRLNPTDNINAYDLEDIWDFGRHHGSELFYPRINVFGFDMAGAIGDVGVWGEAAVFLPPEEIIMQTDLSAFALPPIQILASSPRP
jgi:hypothetical protein